MDMSKTIEADSTQINAVDLAIPMVVTITGSSKGPDIKQPVNLEVAEFPGRVYRPCKSMRRLIVEAWGMDTKTYVGRKIKLYNEKSVKFGTSATGGIRIKGLSHIDKAFTSPQMESQRKYVTYAVEKLADGPPALTQDAEAGFQQAITEAETLADLESIAAELKAFDLGAYKKPLLAAWSDRKKVIEAAS